MLPPLDHRIFFNDFWHEMSMAAATLDAVGLREALTDVPLGGAEFSRLVWPCPLFLFGGCDFCGFPQIIYFFFS